MVTGISIYMFFPAAAAFSVANIQIYMMPPQGNVRDLNLTRSHLGKGNSPARYSE